ncbi:Multicopper oxidase [uncultured Gammaproteobacteria bacterium]|nr:Multicopper oxidase [uncultured Gammaproteobacteria bacterium]
MQRRDFIKTSLVASSTLLISCKEGDSAKSSVESVVNYANQDFVTPPLIEPELINGQKIFKFSINENQSEIFQGKQTKVLCYGNGMLGPTVRVDDTDNIGFEIINNLKVNTTTHFHGLHLPAKVDGGPYQIIPPRKTWKPQWKINQLASTQWYHPHLEGYTGHQVYHGMAGFFIIDDKVSKKLPIPKDYGVDDFPVVVQDRRFDKDGQLLYLNRGDYDLSGGMKGETILVNGRPVPTLQAHTQVIRLRILNGSNARIYNFGFEDDIEFYQIASDGGFLEKPVKLTRVLLGPAERAEILVNLSNFKGRTLKLKSFSAEYYDKNKLYGHKFGEPFKVGGTGRLAHSVDKFDMKIFDIMSIEVSKEASANAINIIPSFLTKIDRIKEFDAVKTRNFGLTVMSGFKINRRNFMSMFVGTDGSKFYGEKMLHLINGVKMDMAVINEVVKKGDTEIWRITNGAHTTHPFHIHDIQFQILDREQGDGSDATPPSENERGWKDTVLLLPEETVRVIAKFDHYADTQYPYMYHCHILEHEDEGMMGQFLVVEPKDYDRVISNIDNHKRIPLQSFCKVS